MPRRRPGAAARRIVAGALLFAGLFVMCFGVGNGRQAVALAGAAVAVLSFGARLVNNVRRTPRQWVRGVGQVLEVSEPPVDGEIGRCTIVLLVDAPGLPPDQVTIHDSRVAVDQWPQPGQELPVQVAADDIRNLRVLWASLPEAGAAESGWEDQESWGDQESWEDQKSWEEAPAWDDQPRPVPAEPPGSHLEPPAAHPERPGGQPEPPGSGSPEDDEVDFDLDGPPTIPLRPVPAAETHRVPRPRPSPRPRRRPEPVPAGAAVAVAGQDQLGDLLSTYPSAHPGPAGAIHGVGVTVLVSDLDRSVAFYRDRLGFYQVDGGDGSAVLASGETRLVLRQAADLGTVTRRLVHLNLEVTDIGAMYAELKANGIRFLYPPRSVSRSARLELWAAAFRDPDGHGIALTQWRSA